MIGVPPTLLAVGEHENGGHCDCEARQQQQAQTNFACAACTRIHHFSRCARHGWNDVVACLSGGLLYGREVPPPPWLTRDRKTAYVKRNRPPSPQSLRRRQRVLELLKQGCSYPQIRAKLNLTRNQLKHLIRALCQQHHIKGGAPPWRATSTSTSAPARPPRATRSAAG